MASTREQSRAMNTIFITSLYGFRVYVVSTYHGHPFNQRLQRSTRHVGVFVGFVLRNLLRYLCGKVVKVNSWGDVCFQCFFFRFVLVALYRTTNSGR